MCMYVCMCVYVCTKREGKQRKDKDLVLPKDVPRLVPPVHALHRTELCLDDRVCNLSVYLARPGPPPSDAWHGRRPPPPHPCCSTTARSYSSTGPPPCCPAASSRPSRRRRSKNVIYRRVPLGSRLVCHVFTSFSSFLSTPGPSTNLLGGFQIHVFSVAFPFLEALLISCRSQDPANRRRCCLFQSAATRTCRLACVSPAKRTSNLSSSHTPSAIASPNGPAHRRAQLSDERARGPGGDSAPSVC
jgi:hypothetical protein